MASRTSWLANHLHPPGSLSDGFTFREADGNPVGLPHLSQYSGSNVVTLSGTSFKFGVNSLAAAESNSKKLQALIDGLPDSGGVIQIPHDIALTTIKLPTRTIRGIEGQPINFRLQGTRPGVQVFGMSEEPLFQLVGGPSGVVHTMARTALCELRDLSITSRGTGVSVKWAGLYFRADNVEIRTEKGPAWVFDECYGLHLGRVGAQGSHNAIGFQFTDCIHVQCDHLWSRSNRIGMLVDGVNHRCSNIFGSIDAEGNHDWQIVLNNCQKSRLDLYMEGHKRIKMNACNDMQFHGDGFRIDEIDELSKLLNPSLYETQLNRITDLLQPYASYNPVQPVITGPRSWSYDTSAAMAAGGHWVDIAPGLPAYPTAGKVISVRWRAKGTAADEFLGRVQWNSGGSVWQNIPIRPSSNWQEYAFETGVAPADGARVFFTGEADSHVDFQLLHIAEVGPREDYCS
jgi:hypothetical protein